jgi:hypothetical protein
MITYKAVGLGLIPGGGALRPGMNFSPMPPGAQAAIQAAAAAGGEAATACADPRLTTASQRAYCSAAYVAGQRGDQLIMLALAQDACSRAVASGLIEDETQETTCVNCALSALAGQFDQSQIPACVNAGGPASGPAAGAATSFLSSFKVPLIVGGVLAAGLGVWWMVR